jgi:hypothetical protein
MFRLTLIAVVAMLLVGPMGATPASSQADVLPAVDAAGVMSPLTPDQLNPAERASFERLTPGSEDATQFLYTRGYLRFCHLVVDEKLAPLALPRLPARENWDRQFLSEEERRNVLDVALAMKLMARMAPAQ